MWKHDDSVIDLIACLNVIFIAYINCPDFWNVPSITCWLDLQYIFWYVPKSHVAASLQA